MTAAAKLDPRSKLFLIICLSGLAVIINNWLILSGILLGAISILLIFGINPLNMAGKIRILLYFVIFIALMQSIFTPGGQVLISLGSIKMITVNGLNEAAEFILRMLIIITASGIISIPQPGDQLQGLVQWKLPMRLAFYDRHGFVFYRFFAEEFKDAMTAIRAAGRQFPNLCSA